MKKDGHSKECGTDAAHFEGIRSKLIRWYQEAHRKLPWRESRNPYHIWISEVMLQQTQVDTVTDYYKRFIERFPTVKTLAEAGEDEVYKAWEGLGYYSRARNLHRAARHIMDGLGGKMPADYDAWLLLPGVGPYTAGAVASIAFGQPVPAVDGNVMRVFSRLFMIQDDIALPGTKKQMNEIGERLVSRDDPSAFNQGLMELGALICTPLSPGCPSCPLREYCRAKASGWEQRLPVKKKKEKQREALIEVAVVKKEGKMLLVKRPPEGLLANLWALPSAPKAEGLEAGNSIRGELEMSYNMETFPAEYLGEAIHVFTHIKWRMKLYELTLRRDGLLEYPEIRWVNGKELTAYALPTAFKKLLAYIAI